MGSIIFIALVVLVLIIVIIRSIFKYSDKKHQYHDTKLFFDKSKSLLETVTKSDRGTYAERSLVVKLLKYGIPAQTIFHDLYLRRPNGSFSQIDLVVVTTAGIIVFEVKDYSGWIFGKGYHWQWTQVLAYGKQKYRFYNPIMQNNKHIDDLRSTRKQFENIPFYSVVVFDGDCELRDISFVPKGTFVVKEGRVLEVIRLIQSFEPAPYTDKHEVVQVMREAVAVGANKETEQQHIDNVTDKLGKHRVFD